jgi:hypothetical protein
LEDSTCLTIADIATPSLIAEWNTIHSDAESVQVGDAITAINGVGGHALDMQSQLDILTRSLETEDLVLDIRPKEPGSVRSASEKLHQPEPLSPLLPKLEESHETTWAVSRVDAYMKNVDPSGGEMYAVSLGRSCFSSDVRHTPASDAIDYSSCSKPLSEDDCYSVAMARSSTRAVVQAGFSPIRADPSPLKRATFDGTPPKMTCYEGIDLQAAAAEMAAADAATERSGTPSVDSTGSTTASSWATQPLAPVAPTIVEVKMPVAGEPLTLPCRKQTAPKPKRKISKGNASANLT